MIKLVYILLLAGTIVSACSGNRSSEERSGHRPNQKNPPPEAQNPKELSLINVTADRPETEMVFFRGGTFFMGSENGLPNELPVHQVNVDSFYIDKHPVTVAQFRLFIEDTGYQTEAEKFGDSGVFNLEKQTWELLKGAAWDMPFGPVGPAAEDDHPVTHVSWNDASAYAAWAGKRLPLEAEWEYAARSGKNSGNKFSWGNQILVNNRYVANTWQGEINAPETLDGYLYTSPIGIFGENEAGVSDMGGNVWQWCADVYMPYPGSNEAFAVNPEVKVIRGGSFFFDNNGENSYSVSGRSMNSHETSLFNTGFRCAKDAGKH